MYISVQSLLTAAAILTAAGALLGAYNKTYNWVQRQQKQDEAIEELKAEQGLLTYGVLACLKGLRERGCNGPVTEAIRTIEKHLNAQAHK